MVNLSPAFDPVLIKGLKVHPENPFQFDFVIDTGNSGLKTDDIRLKEEADKLIKYFLASLTVPEKDLWVNLSPYEKDRMITPALGETTMGRDMLAQDYILKQLTASLIYPEGGLGKTFWDKVYAKARQMYGTAEIPVNTFNKVWIVADKADVFERGNVAYVVGAHLKVMLEEDYVALNKNKEAPTAPTQSGQNVGATASAVVREVILPEIEREVNTGANFAPLRQMFYSMVLASWYKTALKDALLTQVYGNKSKVKVGVNQDDPSANEAIFQRYLQAYKKGVFNYIKEDEGKDRQPKKYFSGGADFAMLAESGKVLHRVAVFPAGASSGNFVQVSGVGVPVNSDAAMTASLTPFSQQGLMDVARSLMSQISGQLDKPLGERTGMFRTFLRGTGIPADGYSIGVDFSGSNLRVVLAKAEGGRVSEVSSVSRVWTAQDKLKPAPELFDIVAQQVGSLIAQAGKTGIVLPQELNTALAFGFPVLQTGVAQGQIARGAEGIKGWTLKGFAGKNIVALVQDALHRNNLDFIKVNTLLNDTTATHLSEPGAVAAAIIGTGLNMTLLSDGEIINTEIGRLDLPRELKSSTDLLYWGSLDPQFRKNPLEKMITGAGLGELVRLELKKLFKTKQIFPDEESIAELDRPGAVDVRFMDQVLSFGTNPQEAQYLKAGLLITEKLGLNPASVGNAEEVKIIYDVFQNVMDRSSQLAALMLAIGLRRSDPDGRILRERGKYIILIDGSTFWKSPGYKERVQKYLGEYGRDVWTASQIEFVQVDKPTALGAAVAALTAPADAAMLAKIDPTQTPGWQKLAEFAFGGKKRYGLRSLFANDPQRATELSVALNEHLDVDFSKNLIDEETLQALIGLAQDASLNDAIEQMFTGAKINETENRAVLHVALRNVKRDAGGKLVAANGPIMADGKDVMPEVIAVLEKMEAFTKKVQSGEWKGASGKTIKNIINVGIGGSDLGPKMAVEALKPYKVKGGPDAYFLSNVDGTAAAELMKRLDPEETLVIIASKTFTTQETMQNAQTLKDWVLKAYNGDQEVIKKHFVAVSTAKKLVADFGIDPQNMFEFWDWVGGRYSVWSAIGLSLATYVGFDNFLQFLEGGREADDHFRTGAFRQNIPVLKALLNVWYGNFLGADSFAILPYDQYLSLFPAFAQQFFMESNGKSVGRDGRPVGYRTGLITWGAAGTDGQHSFYQLIHQGTRLVPADFIGIMSSHNPLPGHHDKFFANFVAQTEALAFGASTEEVRAALENDPKYAGQDLDWHAAQQTFTGNKPTTSILIDKMTPRTLGNLIALYEHQIFVEGVIWNIFSFDQWGVQLGKLVADKKVLPFLTGARSLDELPQSGLSPAAQATIRKYMAAKARSTDAAMAANGSDFISDFVKRLQGGSSISSADINTAIDFYRNHPTIAVDPTLLGIMAGRIDAKRTRSLQSISPKTPFLAQLLTAIESKGKDQAQLAKGGIDLNAANLQLNREGKGVQMQFDPAMIERIKREGFDGLNFEIQKMIPVTNLPVLLGLREDEQVKKV